ncbi:MAG: hypothetical protein IKJ68_11735, partial [Clostridia bacterium]|nr:hypothetical protein [Clostridia bacterium]
MENKAWKILCIALTLLMFIWTVSIIAAADTVPAGYTGIYTKEDLNNVRNNLNGNYILMNDIIFTNADFEAGGEFYNDGMGWVPIGGEFTSWSADYNEFNGIFDGNGYSIRNIKMNRTPTAYTAYPSKTVCLPDGSKKTLNAYHSFGLFACNAGTIKNLNISVDFTINANPYAVAGGICGVNSGQISDCKTSGTLFINKTNDAGDSYLGGIAGLIDGGTITLCANEARLSGKNEYIFPYVNCGGIIGGSTGLFENSVSYCYNTGEINPESASDGYLGGIAARASNGLYYSGFSLVIENCYNAGRIGTDAAEGRIAGICGEGYHEDTKIISCYNAGQILSSGRTAGIVYEENCSTDCYYLNSSADSLWCNYWSDTLYVINALEEARMKTEEAFEGFDFDNVWILDARSDYPYPRLRNNLQSATIPEKHNYIEEITVSPTCTQNGIKTLTCTDCSFVIEVTINAKGHIYDICVVTAPTCSRQGFTTFSCECGDSYITDFVAEDIMNHAGGTEIRDAVAAGCADDGYSGDTYCLACNIKVETGFVIPATGIHNYSSEITVPATHLREGVETFTCICGDSYTQPVEKLPGHTYITAVTAPTCTQKGYTTYTCECKDSYVSDYVPAKGHSYTSVVTTPATHLREGVETFTCICGDSYTQPVEKLPGHTYITAVTAPTCTQKGYTTYICECKDNYVSDYVEKLSHSYKTTTTPATLSANGSIVKKCSLCDYVASNTAINKIASVTLSATSYTYKASVITPDVTVKDSAGNVLTRDTDYTVSYASGRRNVGTY